ncbi:hypothetical protein HZH66_006039 [Vespula vulgaris]|uniref:Uncharacterized protein n=1 Tax=Vespula vulgaris TaxID=7454 RepID=A0A834K6L4_VESVU|nr:hypothetical protein HZH66_006039 [Vespula vulgaris]
MGVYVRNLTLCNLHEANAEEVRENIRERTANNTWNLDEEEEDEKEEEKKKKKEEEEEKKKEEEKEEEEEEEEVVEDKRAAYLRAGVRSSAAP